MSASSTTEIGSKSTPSPERALWLSVLERAILDAAGFVTGLEKKQRPLEQRRAREWFDPDNLDFQMVCTMAGLDPAGVARRLPQIMERYKNGAPKVRAPRYFPPNMPDVADNLAAAFLGQPGTMA